MLTVTGAACHAAAVLTIADQRMVHMHQMLADLVEAPGLRLDLQQRVTLLRIAPQRKCWARHPRTLPYSHGCGGFPQFGQNFVPGGKLALQPAQKTGTSEAPHCWQ